MTGARASQSRAQSTPVPRGPPSHLWVPATKTSQKSTGSGSTPRACTASTTSSGPSSAAASLVTGTFTPVPECTQVTATTFVRGVTAATIASIIASALACAGSS